MRKRVIVFVAAIFMTLSIGINSASALSLDVTVGETFKLIFTGKNVSESNPLIAFGFDVIYDNSNFTFNGAEVLPPFLDDSDFFAETDVAGSTLPDEGVFGNDIFLSILSFTALTEGDFLISAKSDNDLTEGLFFSDRSYAEIDCSAAIHVEPVPEPSTIFLLGIGLAAGAAGLRRRKKN